MSNIIRSLLLLLPIIPLAGGICFAHGDAHKETSPHMKKMLALKDKIPAEYRHMKKTPVPADKNSLANGKELYRRYCVVCHGDEGRGDGPAAGAMATPPANFLDLKHSAIYGPGEKFWIIGNGAAATGMPAFPLIAVKDRWRLVNYILYLQEGVTAPHKEMHH